MGKRQREEIGDSYNEDCKVVFVDTSLDTHLAMLVYDSDTVSDFKKKLVLEHMKCFPEMGEIQIRSLKIKRGTNLYHLPDFLLVWSAFHGEKETWFLSLDASKTSAFPLNDISCNMGKKDDVKMDSENADDNDKDMHSDMNNLQTVSLAHPHGDIRETVFAGMTSKVEIDESVKNTAGYSTSMKSESHVTKKKQKKNNCADANQEKPTMRQTNKQSADMEEGIWQHEGNVSVMQLSSAAHDKEDACRGGADSVSFSQTLQAVSTGKEKMEIIIEENSCAPVVESIDVKENLEIKDGNRRRRKKKSKFSVLDFKENLLNKDSNVDDKLSEDLENTINSANYERESRDATRSLLPSLKSTLASGDGVGYVPLSDIPQAVATGKEEVEIFNEDNLHVTAYQVLEFNKSNKNSEDKVGKPRKGKRKKNSAGKDPKTGLKSADIESLTNLEHSKLERRGSASPLLSSWKNNDALGENQGILISSDDLETGKTEGGGILKSATRQTSKLSTNENLPLADREGVLPHEGSVFQVKLSSVAHANENVQDVYKDGAVSVPLPTGKEKMEVTDRIILSLPAIKGENQAKVEKTSNKVQNANRDGTDSVPLAQNLQSGCGDANGENVDLPALERTDQIVEDIYLKENLGSNDGMPRKRKKKTISTLLDFKEGLQDENTKIDNKLSADGENSVTNCQMEARDIAKSNLPSQESTDADRDANSVPLSQNPPALATGKEKIDVINEENKDISVYQAVEFSKSKGNLEGKDGKLRKGKKKSKLSADKESCVSLANSEQVGADEAVEEKLETPISTGDPVTDKTEGEKINFEEYFARGKKLRHDAMLNEESKLNGVVKSLKKFKNKGLRTPAELSLQNGRNMDDEGQAGSAQTSDGDEIVPGFSGIVSQASKMQRPSKILAVASHEKESSTSLGKSNSSESQIPPGKKANRSSRSVATMAMKGATSEKKSLQTKPGSIFEDDSSGSSLNGNEKVHSTSLGKSNSSKSQISPGKKENRSSQSVATMAMKGATLEKKSLLTKPASLFEDDSSGSSLNGNEKVRSTSLGKSNSSKSNIPPGKKANRSSQSVDTMAMKKATSEKKSLLTKPGSLFEDDSSGGSLNANVKVQSDDSTSSSSSTSADSVRTDGESDLSRSSTRKGSVGGGRSNGEKSTQKLDVSGSKSMPMDMILRNSMMFKKAKCQVQPDDTQ